MDLVHGAGLLDPAVFQLAAAVALGASAGLRTFLPAAAAALLVGLGWIDPGPAMIGLPLLGVLGALALAEVGLDKVPGADGLLDAAGLVLKPLAAAGVVLSLAPSGPSAGVIGAGVVLAAGVAAFVGAAKARLRQQSSIATGGLANAALSLGEDLASVVSVTVAVVVPVLALGGLLALGAALAVAGTAWRRLRWARYAPAVSGA